MTRLHIHISVENLEQSIQFYSVMFGAEPTKQKQEYAKWMLDDPRMNFAISTRSSELGLDHLGIQAEDENKMFELRQRIKKSNIQTFDEGKTNCCYAKSDKTWTKDPTGIAWEIYHTMTETELFNSNTLSATKPCCASNSEAKANCC